MTGLFVLGVLLGIAFAAACMGMAASRWYEGYLACEAYRDELAAVEQRLADTQTAYEQLRKDRGYTDGYRAPGRPS